MDIFVLINLNRIFEKKKKNIYNFAYFIYEW